MFKKGAALKKIMSFALMAAMTGPLCLLPACSDSQSAQNAQVMRTHREVTAILSKAQRSYVPGDEPVETSLVAWRQEQQQEAQAKLQEILDQGTVSQQIATRRLAADIYDSAARAQVIDTVAQWTELSARSALLLSYLQSVDRADAQLRRFSGDASDLMADMRAQAQKLDKQSEDLQKELAQVQATIKEQDSQLQDLSKQLQQLTAQSANLRQQAFSQTGTERHQSYEKAAQAAINANKVSAQHQTLAARREIAQANAAVLSRRLALSNEALKQIETQIKNTQASVADQQRLREKAQKDKTAAIEKLDSELEKIVAQYKSLMDEGFGKSLAQLDQAIELLDKTIAMASDNQMRRLVQLDLLARKISRLHVLSMQASAAGDWARKLGVIAQMASDPKRPGGAMIAGKSTFYETTAQSALNHHNSIIAEGLRTASEANELASLLTQGGSDSDPIATNAATLATLANNYTSQINAGKIQ